MAEWKDKINLEMDFQNLMSCIECHKDEKNVQVMIDTLKTIVNICAEEKLAKDAFRDAGGLDFLLEFLIGTDQVIILEYSLKTLAFVIEGNVNSQMYLTGQKVFKILQAIFVKKTYPLKVLKNAVLLVSTILFQNRTAQDLIYEDESLLSLINLYKSFVPIFKNCTVSENSDHLEIWLDLNRSLCFAVNNPLNEKNQTLCSDLISVSLEIIETSSNPVIIEASSSFLSLTIANNEKNQDAFAEQDGFLILKQLLNKNFEQMQLYMKECNNITSKRTAQIVNSLISVVSSSVLDHEKNAALCGKLGIVSLMIQFLSTEVLNLCVVKKIILALGHCVDVCNENRSIILDVSEFDVLLKKYLENNDEELHSAARYLLQVCLKELSGDKAKDDDLHTKFSDDNFLRSSHEPKKNSAQAETSKETFTPLSSEWKKTLHQTGCDTFSKFLEHSKDLTIFQKRKEKKFPDFTLETGKNDKDFSRGFFFLNNENSNSNSGSEISLQSAGHFYRMQKSKFNRFTQNELKRFPDDLCFLNTTDNCNKGDTESPIEALSSKRYTLGAKTTGKASNMSNQNGSENKYRKCKNHILKSNDAKEQGLIAETTTKNKCSNGSKPGKSHNSKISLKENKKSDFHRINSEKEKLDCINLCELEKKHFENLESDNSKMEQEISPTISGNVISKKSVCDVASEKNCGQSASFPFEENNTAHKYKNINEFPQSYHTFKLQNFRRPDSADKRNDITSQKSKSSRRSKASGCLEVIVLPGVACCEHQLAAQIELLKVCRIEEIEHST